MRLDSIVGVLASHRTTLVLGSPGSGKTLFALQTLVSAARKGEYGLYASFAPTLAPLSEYGAAFGWDIPRLLTERRILVLRLADAESLESVLPLILERARAGGVRRLALDSLHLAPYLPEAVAESRQLVRLRDWLFEHQFTAVLTAGFGGQDPSRRRRRALLQLLSDCTVALEVHGSGPQAPRWLRVLKYRAAPFLDSEFPFYIGSTGIELLVTTPASGTALSGSLNSEFEEARRRFTNEIKSLDRFLEIKQAELDFLLEKNAAAAENENPLSPDEPSERNSFVGD
jgi:circadian clock protein KaiC